MKANQITRVVVTHMDMKRDSLKLSGSFLVLKANTAHRKTRVRLYARKEARPGRVKSHESSTNFSERTGWVRMALGFCRPATRTLIKTCTLEVAQTIKSPKKA